MVFCFIAPRYFSNRPKFKYKSLSSSSKKRQLRLETEEKLDYVLGIFKGGVALILALDTKHVIFRTENYRLRTKLIWNLGGELGF